MAATLLEEAWQSYLKQREDAAHTLQSTLEDLWHKIAQMENPCAEDEATRRDIISVVDGLLASVAAGMGAKLAAEAHGSFIMGCYNSTSTLEVAVTGHLAMPQGSPAGPPDLELRGTSERLALLVRVHGAVSESGMAAPGTLSINRAARVPSVSFEHASSGIPVRICVAYPGFAFRAHVVRGLVTLEPRLRSLVQLVELWAEARGLSNPAAGTFSSWALVQLAIFAMQTYQPQPLLPPLWRVCSSADTASTGGAPPPGPSAGGAPTPGPTAGTGSAARPMQQHQYMKQPCSESLAPVLAEILARMSGNPAETLGLPPAAAPDSSHVGLLPLFHWFLVLLDRLLGCWQLSWNRRWRVSTWHGSLVQQPFSRAFLVPIECPFDPADNAAKSLGCENQPRHQEAFRAVCNEVAASLRLLQGAREPQDLDQVVLGLFGLEVEHMFLEEEEEAHDATEEGEALEEEQHQEGDAMGTEQSSPGEGRHLGESQEQSPSPDSACGPAGTPCDGGDGRAAQSVSAASGLSRSPIAEVRTRPLQADELQPSAGRASSPVAAYAAWHPLAPSPGEPEQDSMPAATGPIAEPESSAAGGAAISGLTGEPSMVDLLDGEAVLVTRAVGPSEGGGQQAGQGSGSGGGASAAASSLRANAMVQRPLSPLLRDVTNGRQHSPEHRARGPDGAPGTPFNPFNDFFGTLVQGARLFFDNVAQGVAELGEDLNDFAASTAATIATTAATLRAIINDDEDLPFLPSSANRRQRRHRLQLLHRSTAGLPGGAGDQASSQPGPSPAPSLSPQSSQRRTGQRRRQPSVSPSPGVVSGPGADCSAAGSPAFTTPTRSAGRPGRQGPQDRRQGGASSKDGTPRPPASRRRSVEAGSAVAPLAEAAVAIDASAKAASTAAALPLDAAAAPDSRGSPALTTQRQRSVEGGTADGQLASSGALVPGRMGGACSQPPVGMAHGLREDSGEATCGLSSCSDSAVLQGAHPSADGIKSLSKEASRDAIAASDAVGSEIVVTVDGSQPEQCAGALVIADGAATEAVPNTDDGNGTGAGEAAAPVPHLESQIERAGSGTQAPPAPHTRPHLGANHHPPASPAALLSLRRVGGSAAPSAGVNASAAQPGLATPTPAGTAASNRPLVLTPVRSLRMPSEGQSQGTARKPGAPPAPPPPLPPPPPPPVGMGGLRVKSAAFRKGAARESVAAAAAAAATALATHSTESTSTPAVSAIRSAVSRIQAAGVSTPELTPSAAAPPAARTTLTLSSTRLQELAEALDRAGPATTIDLGGRTFAGPLAHPVMKITAPGLHLENGELLLQPDQQLCVSAKDVRFADVQLRDAAPAQAEAAPVAASGGGGSAVSAARPAVLVTKQSYAAGGALALVRCRLDTPGRGIGLQVKGKGCSVAAEDCSLAGGCQATVQVSDAAASLTRCRLHAAPGAAAGQGLCARDNATVTAADCRFAGFGGAAAAALAGASLELSACTLDGAEAGAAPGDASVTGSGGLSRSNSGGGGSGSSACGLLVEGKGSVATARGSVLQGFVGGPAVSVTAGGSCNLDDCTAKGSLCGAMVGVRGGRLAAARSHLSHNATEGLVIAEGATAQLRECALGHNGAAGMRVGGVGSMAIARGCEVVHNGGGGVHVQAGGCVTLEACAVADNGAAPACARAQEADAGTGAAVSAVGGPCGLAVEGTGARATAHKCSFSRNAAAGVAAAEHGAAVLTACTLEANGGGAGLAVEVGAYGRVTLGAGCSWREGHAGEGLRVHEQGVLETSG